MKKISERDLIHTALGEIAWRIEQVGHSLPVHGGASIKLADAACLVSDLRAAVGNKSNVPSAESRNKVIAGISYSHDLPDYYDMDLGDVSVDDKPDSGISERDLIYAALKKLYVQLNRNAGAGGMAKEIHFVNSLVEAVGNRINEPSATARNVIIAETGFCPDWPDKIINDFGVIQPYAVRGGLQLEMMKYDPVTGEEKPYPSHAEQYRKYHGKVAWMINPWTGLARDPRDIGSDVFGLLIA